MQCGPWTVGRRKSFLSETIKGQFHNPVRPEYADSCDSTRAEWDFPDPRLPPELCDLVVDFVSELNMDDPQGTFLHNVSKLRREALLACALTCRSWRVRSLSHLYAHILLYTREDLDRLSAFFRARSTLATYVRTLTASTTPMDNSNFIGPCVEWTHLVPLSLSSILSNLDTLSLGNCDWNALHPSFFMFASKFATVTKLDLGMINLRTSRELVEFISSFHSLSYLTLSAMRCKKLRPNPARRVTQPLSRIEIIGTTGHCIANLLIFFHGANSHSRLIELDISPSESSVLDASMDFIHGSVSLRHLTFSLCNLPESNSETGEPLPCRFIYLQLICRFLGSLNLNSAMELRTLLFKAKYPVSHIAFLIRTLSTVRRSKLKEVVVHVNFGPELQDLDE